MQWIFVGPLIEKFKARAFDDAELGPYFFGSMLFQTAGTVMLFQQANAWTVAQGIGVLLITVWGLFHLKRCNGGGYGHDFLKKWFVLGWIITIRLVLLTAPVLCMLFTFLVMFRIRDHEAFVLLLAWGMTVVHYVWLGLLFAAALPPDATKTVR